MTDWQWRAMARELRAIRNSLEKLQQQAETTAEQSQSKEIAQKPDPPRDTPPLRISPIEIEERYYTEQKGTYALQNKIYRASGLTFVAVAAYAVITFCQLRTMNNSYTEVTKQSVSAQAGANAARDSADLLRKSMMTANAAVCFPRGVPGGNEDEPGHISVYVYCDPNRFGGQLISGEFSIAVRDIRTNTLLPQKRQSINLQAGQQLRPETNARTSVNVDLSKRDFYELRQAIEVTGILRYDNGFALTPETRCDAIFPTRLANGEYKGATSEAICGPSVVDRIHEYQKRDQEKKSGQK